MLCSSMQGSLGFVVLAHTFVLTPAPCPGASKCKAPDPAPTPAPAPAPAGGPPAPPPAPAPAPPPPAGGTSSGTASNSRSSRLSAVVLLVLSLFAFAMGDASADAPTTTTSGMAPEAQKVDCQGNFEETPCYGGVKGRYFKMTVPPSGGGAECPADKVTAVECAHTPIDLDWAYVVPKTNWTTAKHRTHGREIPLVVCPRGSKVSFNWKGTVHDVRQMLSEEAYNTCKFDKAVSVKDASSSDSFTFHCDTVGTHYFACSVGDACSSGAQRVRIYVSDPVKTLQLRARGGMSLEQFNRKYTLVSAGYYLNNQALALNNADQAILDAESVLAQSPQSCADWIPESWNTDQNCRAFVYTDLGFLSRVRPDPDFEASERYYRKALEISPGMCGATSYLAELRVQQSKKADADRLYIESCHACGQDSMDFHDLVFAYENRSWTPPNCTSTTSLPSSATPSGVMNSFCTSKKPLLALAFSFVFVAALKL